MSVIIILCKRQSEVLTGKNSPSFKGEINFLTILIDQNCTKRSEKFFTLGDAD